MKKLIMIVITMIVMMNITMTVEAPNRESNYNVDNLYSISTVVDEVDYSNDVVIVVDVNGKTWKFSGCEDWLVGDVCVLTMFDNKTDLVYDDVILKTTYNGYVY